MPRDGWLAGEERQAILDFHKRHPLDVYRRLAYRLLDAGLVAASPSKVYRALKAVGWAAGRAPELSRIIFVRRAVEVSVESPPALDARIASAVSAIRPGLA